MPNVRKVRTPEGSRFYGKPIGSPITAADIAAAKNRSSAAGFAKGQRLAQKKGGGVREPSAQPPGLQGKPPATGGKRKATPRTRVPDKPISVKPAPPGKPGEQEKPKDTFKISPPKPRSREDQKRNRAKGNASVDVEGMTFDVSPGSETFSRESSPVKYNLDGEKVRVFTPEGEVSLDGAQSAKVRELLDLEQEDFEIEEHPEPEIVTPVNWDEMSSSAKDLWEERHGYEPGTVKAQQKRVADKAKRDAAAKAEVDAARPGKPKPKVPSAEEQRAAAEEGSKRIGRQVKVGDVEGILIGSAGAGSWWVFADAATGPRAFKVKGKPEDSNNTPKKGVDADAAKAWMDESGQYENRWARIGKQFEDSQKDAAKLDDPTLDDIAKHKDDKGRPDGAGTPDDPIYVGKDLDKAMDLLSEGKYVRIDPHAEDLRVLTDKMAAHKGPTIDICKVAVGPSLFCSGSKGRKRVTMPQFSSKNPTPGSKAAEQARPDGSSDMSDQFKEDLAARGVKITTDKKLASAYLPAQEEMLASKSAGIAKALRDGKVMPGTVFVSRDGYVIDGHHRWAAVAINDGLGEGDGMMDVEIVDMDIADVLLYANEWTEKMGLPHADLEGAPVGPDAARAADNRPAPRKGSQDEKHDLAMADLGVKYSEKAADDPEVQRLKKEEAPWENAPTEDVNIADLIGTEEYVQSRHVNKVVKGGEPLREGYDPKILRTDEGDIIIDGHTRAAMHAGLGNKTMRAQVIDQRTKRPDLDGMSAEEQSAALDSMVDSTDLKIDEAEDQNFLATDTTPGSTHAKAVYDKAAADEPELSKSMKELAYRFGAKLEGFAFRRKNASSLVRKINKDLADGSITPEEAAANIRDAVRYTMTMPAGNFTKSAQAIMDDMREQGFSNFRVKNFLQKKGVMYRGINMTMTHPNGTTFELQFHTPESLFIKMEGDPNVPKGQRVALHKLYDEYRELDPESPRAKVLEAQMIAMSDLIPTPDGVENFG